MLSLGSNLGRRRTNLSEAKKRLEEKGIQITKTSQILETKPVDVLDQPDFLNQLVIVQTKKSPEELLNICLAIEDLMGRKREIPKGPRNIDIDLLYYYDEVRTTPELILPHPAIKKRHFLVLLLKNLGILPLPPHHYD